MRHALYFAPPIHHPLWAIGNAWLGRNPETGETVSQPTPPDFTAEEIRDATASPRRYGLHATLKAPFRLAAGCDETGLRRRLTRFAAAHASFVLTPLEVAVIDDFIALKTKDPSAQLRVLADAAVMEFDDCRAPLDAEELARRRPETLDEAARERLARWGYPHVLEGFEFHVSLSGPLPAPMRERLLPWLADHFAPALAVPCPFDALCLYVEPSPGDPFRLIERAPLGALSGTPA